MFLPSMQIASMCLIFQSIFMKLRLISLPGARQEGRELDDDVYALALLKNLSKWDLSQHVIRRIISWVGCEMVYITNALKLMD